MNVREYSLLELINIAGAQRGTREFWCTAQDMVDTLREEKESRWDRFEFERMVLGAVSARDIGYLLRRLNCGFPIRGQKLVEKRRVHGVNQWRMTPEALRICIS